MDDLDHRNLFIHEAIDERGVRTIFEKATHQVGEQILVFSNRSVHAYPREICDLPGGLGIQKPLITETALKGLRPF